MASQPPSSYVPRAAVERAVNALLKWKSDKSAAQNPQLLPSDEFLYLVLTLIKIPAKTRVNALKVQLPHPLYTPENSDICLFVADNTSETAKSKVEDENLPVNQVLKLRKLKKDYKAYEQKRKLCDSYDLFLAEKRIVPLLPNVIGKEFYKKKKIPVPVELSKGNWREQIESVCSSALLYLSSGSCSVVKVGRASMDRKEIVENVLAAVEGVANVVPKKWRNVRSFHLKFSESLALPVYQKVPEFEFKIGGGEGEVEVEEEVDDMETKVVKTKTEGSGMTSKKMKGRIHDVRYLDEFGGESEGEEVVDDEDEEVGKKRKKVYNAKVLSQKKSKKSKILI